MKFCDSGNGIIFILLTVLCISVLCLSGCSSKEPLRGTMIPGEIEFAGKTYKATGEIVAVEPIPDEVQFIGHSYLGEETTDTPVQSESSDTKYEVYSIEGLDQEQSIAIKTLLVGTKTRAYYYRRYDRESEYP